MLCYMCELREAVVELSKVAGLCAECAARYIRAQGESLEAALREAAHERKEKAKLLGRG